MQNDNGAAVRGGMATENIAMCEDGKYRWVYELNLVRNPSVFLTVWKIFFFIILAGFSILAVIDAFSAGEETAARLLYDLKIFGFFIAGMTVLDALACLIYPLLYGGDYCIVFEMDGNGINHKQMPKQAKKAELMALITALAGIAAKNPTAVGIGLASARTEMYTDFSKVKKIKPRPLMHLIKLNARLDHNQVYVSKEDYDFVLNYITGHCPNARA